jgi:hypothetical protein
MDKTAGEIVDERMAIVCSHVHDGGLPILRAHRDLPDELVDSGCQLLCGADNHNSPNVGKLWQVCEALELKPSPTDLIATPPGTILTRKDVGTQWESSGTRCAHGLNLRAGQSRA